jgi:small GTP-binding protein
VNSDIGREITLKFILVGGTSAGKTQIIRTFIEQKFNPDVSATVGASFVPKTIDIRNRKVNLQLWDTSGVERSRQLLPMYCRDTQAALFVYDVTSSYSFAHIGLWLEVIRAHSHPHIALILIGTKTDLVDERQVRFEDGESFADREHMLFIETSAKDATNLSQAFELMAIETIRRIENGDLPKPPSAKPSRPKP